MRRREFVAGLASVAAWPPAARAQSISGHFRIGVLDTSARGRNANFTAFRQVLVEHGYVEDQNLSFEYRSADGRNASFAELAGELARLNVDLIVTRGTPAALAARAATATIPVVMAAAGDPLAIARGARSAANMTGFGANIAGAERKRVAILKEMLPRAARLAALMNLSNPSRQSEWQEIEAGARALGIEPRVLDTRTAADLERSFDTAASQDTDALVVGSDTIMQTNQGLVVRLAAAHRLPAIYTFRDFVEAGGLVSYGVSLPDLYRRAAIYADKILRGAKPLELPIGQPTGSELVVSRQAARALGLALPETLLSHAEMIE